MEKIKIAELSIDTDKLLKEMQESKKSIDNLVEAQKDLKKSGDTSSQTYIKQEAQLKKLKSEYNSQVKTLQQVTGVTDTLNAELAKETKSLGDAAAQNKKLRQARENLNLTTEEGQKALKQINKKIDENTDFMKENQDAQIQNKMNVGNYTDSITEALGIQQAYNVGVQAATPIQAAFNFVVGKSTNAVTAQQKALRLLKIAFAGTGIGLVVLALGSLITYLTSTQEGINKVNMVLTPLKEVFAALLGVVQNLGKDMFDAFSDPKQLIADVGTAIKNNLINRFTALGKIIESTMNMDWAGVADGVAQAATGVEDLGGKMKKAADDTGKFFGDAVNRGKEIETIRQKLSKDEADFIKQQGQLRQEFKEQNRIAEDQTKSQSEREAAARRSIEVQEQMSKNATARLQLEADLIALQQQANDTSDADATELAKKLAEVNDAIAAENEAVTTQQNKLNGIVKQGYTDRQKQRQEDLQNKITDMEQELELYDEQQRLKVKTAEDELTHMKQMNQKELKVLKEKLDNKLISETEYETEKQKKKNDVIAKEEEIHQQELARIEQYENEKRKMENDLMLAKEEDELVKAELKAQLEYEAHVREIEQMQLKEDEKTELLRLAQENREQILNDIKEKYQEEALSKFSEAMEKDTAIRLQNAQEAAQIASQLTNMLRGFLGDSLAAQIAGIAVDAAIQAATVNIAANAAQARNLAQAAAVAPPPANLPFIGMAMGQNAMIQAQATKSTTSILANAALSALGSTLQTVQGRTAKPKFAQGGNIFGASHSGGGVDINAEGGESIINKKSTKKYGGILSAINQAEGGKPIMGGNQAPSGLIDYERLGAEVAKANLSLPSPRVAVDEIRKTETRAVSIEERARF